jgi:hypothetical protein
MRQAFYIQALSYITNTNNTTELKLLQLFKKKQKCHFLFFYKIEEQKGRTGLAWGRGGKRAWEVNIVQICAHVYANGKMRPVKTVVGMGG